MYSRTFREAKEENAIRDPKSLLWAMRTNCSYFEGKLRLLHQLKGLNALQGTMIDSPSQRDWFRGYYTYSNKETILKAFSDGKPLSCFCLEHDFKTVHVAFSCSKDFKDHSDRNRIGYISFKVSLSWVKHEAGLHFCKFTNTGQTSYSNKKTMKATNYAIMLPYILSGKFIQQYTLIYDDWEVLLCEGPGRSVKGHTPVCRELFEHFVSGLH